MSSLTQSYSPSTSKWSPDGMSQEAEPASSEELTEQQSQWLSKLFQENPQLLALRERVLPWTGGYSFANVVHTDTTAVLTHVNRHTILELVYQHLHAIGMHRTAEALQAESGHQFQQSDQPWDKTDLLLLVSLGVLPRENPWQIVADPHHQFVEETLEEDFFASPYREDSTTIYQEFFDRNLGAVYSDPNVHTLETLKLSSLKHLVIVLCNSSNDVISDAYIIRFFLTLHTITSAHHFLEHLLALFDLQDQVKNDPEKYDVVIKKQNILRRSIINLIKRWVTYHGLFIGKKTLKSIRQFMRRIAEEPEEYKGLEKFASATLKILPTLIYGMKTGVPPDPAENPSISDPQIIFRPGLKLTDPDPIETARQICMLYNKAFQAVHSREFMLALGSQSVSHQTPTLSEFFEFGDRLTRLCLETIITAHDRNAAYIKLLKGAEQLDLLFNYDGVSMILHALKREEFATFECQTQQVKNLIRVLTDKCGDNPQAIIEYQKIVNSRSEQWLPTIPNIRVELKGEEIDKSPSFIDGLINWDKRWKISKKAAILYRFQNKPFNFWEIPQIQDVINRGPITSQKQIEEKLFELQRSNQK